MNNISVVIPTYNTSKYFREATELPIKSDFVEEIVVIDDCSSEEDWNNLQQIVSELNCDKIKLHRNEKNLGGFRNKYLGVQKASCDWVFLLDSDNFVEDATLDIISSIEDPDPNVCYAPQVLMKHQGAYHGEHVVYNFNYDMIGIDEAQDAFLKRTKFFDWFVNNGNFVFNKENYLKKLKKGFDSTDEPLFCCSFAFSYHWMISGGLYKIVDGWRYNHRFRDDSYFMTCGKNSFLSVEYYKQRIINLQ